MKKTKRIIAVVLCVLIVALPVLSQCFIATHRRHACTGKNCGVCCELYVAEQIIETFKTVLLSAICFSISLLAVFMPLIYGKQIHRVGDTLITLKVELLN